jgi:hypothetical protein
MSSVKRVTPALSPQQNFSPDFDTLSDSPIASDQNSSSLAKLITYDVFEKKFPQQLLYEVYRKRMFFFSL